jgi:hypothetical protein
MEVHMKKSLSRTLYLIGLGILILGMISLFVSIPGGTTTTNPYGGTTATPGNSALFGIALVLIFIGTLPMLIAWIGALVKMAHLRQWAWFVLLLVVSGITMLVYIFAGPETPYMEQSASTMVPPDDSRR